MQERPRTNALRSVARAAWLAASLLSSLSFADGPRLAVLVTRGNGPETTLHFATPGAPLPEPAARFSHLPDAAVRGALLPGTETAVVVADEAPGRDRSWGSSLFVLAPRRPVRRLCDRVACAARPLVAEDGAVVVARGEPGVPRPGEIRVDALSVDEVDPATGEIRTLYVAAGFAAFPAAVHAREVVVYVVMPDGARLVAVDRGTHRVRVLLASLPPFARDFSVSAQGRLVFANRDATRPDLWTVESVDLASGETRRLLESRFSALAPHAWGGGGVTWNGETGRGLSGTVRALSSPAVPGLVEIVATSPDGTLAAAHLLRAGASTAEAVLLDRNGRLSLSVPPPAGARLEVAGILP